MPNALAPPIPPDEEAIARAIRRWRELPKRAGGTSDPDEAGRLIDHDQLGPVLRAIFAYSPFLTESALVDHDLVLAFAGSDAHAILRDELAAQENSPLVERSKLTASLRRLRRRVALLTALADLQGQWSLAEVTSGLSRLADLAVEQALSHGLLQAAQRGQIELKDDRRPTRDSGIFVLGMGKLGSLELNYSSDIDLIVLFDAERLAARGVAQPMPFTIGLTRTLTHLLEHRVRGGYVFRTDLRLRPHPPGHPLALSTEDALIYYERHGQNWERAAFIKARVVAGDLECGETFLHEMQPFVWRKHLDYAAIRDIQSIKRQINAFRGFAEIAVRGHDLKVGRGGIREIEFFVQTQQLILGGRHPELRSRATLEGLCALVEGRWIDAATGDDLRRAYGLLRELEHRLQMVADKQTQLVPSRDQEFERFARFAGFDTERAFEERLDTTLRAVERHYAWLFESEPDLGAGGRLVFTGTDDDAETLETLRNLGFRGPNQVSARIRAWHHGHIRATRSTRARELLTELAPSLLAALQRQSDPDEAFRLFDNFLSGLPAGVQFFSLIRANPKLLRLITDIMGAAPRLARHLSGNVDLFEAMLTPDFFEDLPGAQELEAELEVQLFDGQSLEDVLDIMRRWARGRKFQAGLQVLLGICPSSKASASLTTIAEIVVRELLSRAESWLEERHGTLEGGRFTVIGLGKFGSRELVPGSDLDLVFVYDAPAEARSNGDKQLDAGTYYARLGQRLVSAISARTAAGTLYEIDTRLRPSGNLGPVACSLGNFERYQRERAQTWEQQALTRARTVAGDETLADQIRRIIEATIRRERSHDELRHAVREMRERIFKEHGSTSPWNVKHTRGGILEIEFTAQFLQLAHAHADPELCTSSTDRVVEQACERRLLEDDDARQLLVAHRLFHALHAVLRLALMDDLDPKTAPEGLREALVRAVGRQFSEDRAPADFTSIERWLIASEEAVRHIFERICAREEGQSE